MLILIFDFMSLFYYFELMYFTVPGTLYSSIVGHV